MSDAHPSDHPYAALAAYVDGSAGDAERHEAEAHLQGCALCRRDVELASAGRAAARSLPEVEAPRVAAAVAATLGLDEDDAGAEAPVVDLDQRRARRWHAVWGAGLAAAAIVAAVLVSIGLFSGGSSPTQGAAPAAAPSEGTGDSRPLTQDSVDALARDLAGGEGGSAIAPAASPPGVSREALTGASAEAAETCVRSAGAVDPAADATEVFAGTFQGTPAYVGAFTSAEQVQVIVASRDGCQPLYTAAARTG